MKKECVRIEKSVLIILGILISIGFVFAGVYVAGGVTTTFDSVNESTNILYNITIENLNTTAPENWTEINITLPSGFVFVVDSNDTDAGTHTFSNTSTILSWSNDGLVMNLTNQSFWFNATSSSIPGDYNFTVTAFNDSAIVETQNISITVNDTVAPSAVVFASPGLSVDGANLSQSSIPINISVTDLGTIDTINITLYNSTQNLINSSANTSNVNSWYYNFTGLSDGVYYINATVNDTFGNSNSSTTLNITLDTTAPSISFSCTDSTIRGGTITCTCTATDSGSGVNSTSYTANPSTSSVGTFSTTCTATDHAGNSASSSESYTITSSGGGSIGVPSFWKQTYVQDTKEFSDIKEINKELLKKYRIRIKIDNEKHYIGLVDLTSTTATINISSTPQQATLNIGDEKKFDVNEDNYYDLSVKLNAIENNKANLTIQSIYELIEEKVVEDKTVAEKAKEKVKETVEEIQEEKTSTTIWIIIGVIVVLVLAGIGYNKYRK